MVRLPESNDAIAGTGQPHPRLFCCVDTWQRSSMSGSSGCTRTGSVREPVDHDGVWCRRGQVTHDTGGLATDGLGCNATQPAQGNPGFGAFERHTRGIGAKLLKQMGYEDGCGLGKDNQGIVDPIQPKKWHKRAGLGTG